MVAENRPDSKATEISLRARTRVNPSPTSFVARSALEAGVVEVVAARV